MADELWTPGGMVEVEGAKRRVLPGEGKSEGGTFFDDELETEESVQARVARQTFDLIAHLNARPDHNVYVGSTEARTKMRAAFNVWKRKGLLGHNPNIRIEYGVPEEGLRVAE